ncbi:3-hydroxyacyl-CoA dehydrogenase, partial [Mycobacterium tuberculosis]
PANVMKLLEVVRGKATGKDVLATVMAIGKKIKKTAVVSGVCDGFIGNRMIEQYSRQAGFLLDEGATPQQVDKAIE